MDASYANGSWIKKLQIDDIACVVYPQTMGAEPPSASACSIEYKDFVFNPIDHSLAQSVVSLIFSKDSHHQDIKDATALNERSIALGKEADLAASEGVALLFLSQGHEGDMKEAALLDQRARDAQVKADTAAMEGTAMMFLGKGDDEHHLEEAKLLQKEAEEAKLQGDSAALQGTAMLFMDSNNKGADLQEEAAVAKEAAAKAVAEEAAKLMMMGLAAAKKKEAAEEKQRELEARERLVADMFSAKGAKGRLSIGRPCGDGRGRSHYAAEHLEGEVGQQENSFIKATSSSTC
jgi:hypothetical protein